MTVVCLSTTRPVLNDFDWVENAGILSSFIPVEKCPSVMTLDCVQKHVIRGVLLKIPFFFSLPKCFRVSKQVQTSENYRKAYVLK
jgi:hypothetical protein